MKPVLVAFDVFYHEAGVEELPTPWPVTCRRILAYEHTAAEAVVEYYGGQLFAVVQL